MKAKFWYVDNWSGAIREFNTLREAKAAAKNETGTVVYITNSKTKQRYEAAASGHTPS